MPSPFPVIYVREKRMPTAISESEIYMQPINNQFSLTFLITNDLALLDVEHLTFLLVETHFIFSSVLDLEVFTLDS